MYFLYCSLKVRLVYIKREELSIFIIFCLSIKPGSKFQIGKSEFFAVIINFPACSLNRADDSFLCACKTYVLFYLHMFNPCGEKEVNQHKTSEVPCFYKLGHWSC